MVGKRTRLRGPNTPTKIEWYYAFTYQKVRYYQSGFSAKSEAVDAEFKKLTEVKGKLGRPIARKFVSFDMWLPKFIEFRKTMGKSPRTVGNEARRGKVLAKRFGQITINDIESRHIVEYIAERKMIGISARTINLELTFLRTFFKHAMQNHLAQQNPAREVTNLPEEDNEEVWIPNETEFMRFIEVSKTLPTAMVFVPWLWFRALTGTRPSESFFVEWKDIEFDNNRIWIRPKPGNPIKTRKKRFIPIHPDLKPILIAWKQEWDEIQARWWKRNGRNHPDVVHHEWVFFSPHDHDDQLKCFLRSFQHARKMSKLPQMTSYTLRHYFISRSIMSGIGLYTIAKWVGHRGTRMIEKTYGHISPDFSAGEMAKLRVTPDVQPDEPVEAEETKSEVLKFPLTMVKAM